MLIYTNRIGMAVISKPIKTFGGHLFNNNEMKKQMRWSKIVYFLQISSNRATCEIELDVKLCGGWG